eukprot:8313661-Pyramimonas_sp.AAC.1
MWEDAGKPDGADYGAAAAAELRYLLWSGVQPTDIQNFFDSKQGAFASTAVAQHPADVISAATSASKIHSKPLHSRLGPLFSQESTTNRGKYRQHSSIMCFPLFLAGASNAGFLPPKAYHL